MAIPHVVQLATGLRRSWRRRDPEVLAALARLDRGPISEPRLVEGPVPCIEQIIAELRRLDRQRRRGPTTESTLWLAAVLRAYDAWLRLACHSLGLSEHLRPPLEGFDLEMERVRVEDELAAKGLTFR
jgi:hypothetical protein